MAFDSALFGEVISANRGLARSERVALLIGGAGAGALAGGFVALAFGKVDLAFILAACAPLLALALYLTAEMLHDALQRGARGCAIMAGAHATALLAWPLLSLFASVSGVSFFVGFALAMATLALFASCWNGPSRAAYRLAGQGALVAFIGAYQGIIVVVAN